MTRRSLPLILSFLFVLFLSACGGETTTTSLTTTASVPPETTTTTTFGTTTTTSPIPLAIPSGIVLEDGSLIWDAVEGATAYVLELDGTEYNLEVPSYDLSSLLDGTHTARVLSQDGVRRSSFSDLVTFLLIQHPGVPYGLKEEAGFLIWDPVDNATGYRVVYGETSADVEGTSFALSALPANSLFSFTVSALFGDDTVSDPSLPFLYDTCATELDEIGMRFLKSAPQDLILDFSLETWTFLGIKTAEGTLLDPSLYTLDAGILTFAQETLLDFPYGIQDYRILTDAGFVAFSMEIADDRQPYMVSSGQVTFTGEDILLEFEIYDGTIDALSGNGITEQDYLIQGNTVRISAAYVAGKFAENPERVTLILGYTLSANQYVSIGYVFIRLPE